MNERFQNLFVTPKDNRPLHYIGAKRQGRWTHGHLQTTDEQVQFPVLDGIPRFIKPEDDPWGSDAEVDELLAQHQVSRQTLIENNWTRRLQEWNPGHKHYEWVRRVVSQGGLICEFACGPGGGLAPLVLAINPEATLLLNDIGRWPLEAWWRLSQKHRLWSKASFAQFDATQCPLGSDTLDCVISSGGITNIDGSHRALAEAYRILRPGGKLFMGEGVVDLESFNQLPKEVQLEWRTRDPDIGQSYEVGVERVGFEIVSLFRGARFALQPDESDLAQVSTKHGITMYMIGLRLEARKPH